MMILLAAKIIAMILLNARTTAVDGAALGFFSVGEGPGLVIIHGAMQSGVSQLELAHALAHAHTVHLLDRRGRGLSDTVPSNGTEQEVDDLLAVLAATGSHDVFGVSSGAIIAARAALASSDITRLALFEPPLSISGSVRLNLIPRFEAALNGGNPPRAMAMAMKIAQMGPSWMFGLPTPLLETVSRRMLAADDDKQLPEGEVHVRELVEALRSDLRIVSENNDHFADFAQLTAQTLLINGNRTRPYLRNAVAALAAIIPNAHHTELVGQNHAVTQNRSQWGHPELVAPPLLEFFAVP